MAERSMNLGFLTGDANEIRKEQSKRQEKKLARDLGGTTTIGSGNKGMKGDAYGGDPDAGQRVMVEAKSTKNKSMSLKLAWLDKLVREAMAAGMEPAVHLRFEAAQFQGFTDWMAIPHSRYLELLDIESKYNGLK